MTTSVSILQENSKEQVVRAMLEEATWPGELLLGYVQCRLNPGTLEDRVFLVGLTQRRFLLVSPDEPDRSYTIYREFVQHVSCGQAGWLRRHELQIELGGDTLVLSCSQEWQGQAQKLVETHAAYELDPLYLTSMQFLQQITDLTDLGLLRIARMLLQENVNTNPVIEIEPETAELEKRLNESRRALHTGAAIFTFTLLFMILMALLGHARLGWSTFLMLPAVIGLLRGQQSRRGFALFMASLVSLGSVMLNAMSASYINMVMWASFGAAMFLTLSGHPRRSRVNWAVMIFVAGFVLIPMIGAIELPHLQPAWWSEGFLRPFGWM